MKLASSPCILCIFAEDTLVLVKKFTSDVSNVLSVVEIFSVKATHTRFCTISAFRFQRNCSPSLSSEKKCFTQVKKQQQPDQSTDETAILAGHQIKRWRLVFITQERIICDLNKKRKTWFWVSWAWGYVSWAESELILSVTGRKERSQWTFHSFHFILGPQKTMFSRLLTFRKDTWFLQTIPITRLQKIKENIKISMRF